MSPTVLLLVAIAAAIHVLWNTLVKICVDKPSFALLSNAFAVLILSPAFMLVRWFGYAPMGINFWCYSAFSGFFEAMYTILLCKAYEVGDLSIIYPLSRGVAPAFTTLLGGLLVGDHIGSAHFVAVLVIISGVITVSISANANNPAELNEGGILLAVATGAMIAGYQLVDRGAMAHANAPHPVEYLFAVHLFLAFFIAIWVVFICGRRRCIIDEWSFNRKGVVTVGCCVPIAYFLILVALKYGNVTYVAAARNTGILFSTVIGWLFLKESISRLKALGTIVITLGVSGLAMLGHWP